MSLELKTINELVKYSLMEKGDQRAIDVQELKEKVIFYIKHFREAKERFKNNNGFDINLLSIPEKTADGDFENIPMTEDTCKWIKYFFNITEEELK